MKVMHKLAHQDTPQACDHPEGSLFYYLAPNEDGWKCTCGFQPGEPPGFSPQLDRKQIWIKVYGLLNDLTNANFISISNGNADRWRDES